MHNAILPVSPSNSVFVNLYLAYKKREKRKENERLVFPSLVGLEMELPFIIFMLGEENKPI